jgi:hypothetical protein
MGPSGKVLHLCTGAHHGYPYVAPSVKGKQRSIYAHIMICEAFHGARPEGHLVRHMDGDRTHISPENLEYGTPLENQRDRARHGTDFKGERHPHARLTEAEVREIRDLYDHKIRLRDIADHYGISPSTAQQVGSRRRWAHVGDVQITIRKHAENEARRLRATAATIQLSIVMDDSPRERLASYGRVQSMLARAERLEKEHA